MAQLLSPICTDALKLWSCSASPIGTRRNFLRPAVNRQIPSGRFRGLRIKAATGISMSKEVDADDYYSVLGVLPDATPEEIKKAYYNCMKACHPDLSGNDPETNDFCMFINEVYEVLSDPVQRKVYDEIHGYALTAVNPFLDDSKPKDHAFVDEFRCIGCKNCANLVPDVFRIEEDFGRARVCSQSGNPALVQQAIESCPVDCIHWTSAAQLSLLEDEMRRMERVNVGLMLSGMGAAFDVFTMARSRWEKRQMKILEKAKIRMMKKKSSEKSESYWSNLWDRPTNYKNAGGEVRERSKRAAAAARRWREYSRRGADRPPNFKLPEALSKKE